MKFTAAALIGAVSAFPSFDSFHAHCAFDVTFQQDCHTTVGTIKTLMSGFADPAGGIYAIKQQDDNSVWVTRTTPTKHYVDDIEFVSSGNSNGTCKISSKSRSQTLSYYDYDTNYCNMYNVLRQTGASFSTPATNECKWVPDNAATTCNKY